MSAFQGITTEQWRELQWWPEGERVLILPGPTGHEKEITATISCYDHNRPIPGWFFGVFESELPETWLSDNRGSRVEVHPTGHRYNGWTASDVDEVGAAFGRMGLIVVDSLEELWR